MLLNQPYRQECEHYPLLPTNQAGLANHWAVFGAMYLYMRSQFAGEDHSADNVSPSMKWVQLDQVAFIFQYHVVFIMFTNV